MLLPEMVTPGIRIGDVRLANPQHLFQHGPISERHGAQRCPIVPLAAGDDVVDRSQGVLLMGEVTV